MIGSIKLLTKLQ